MARFEKSRPKSAKPHAAVAPARPRGSTAPSIEDTMFFPRLRRHAKWMFVLLALVFGLGFVVFGVGAGGTGVGDIFRGSGGTSGPSVSSTRKATEERPKDPQAWRDYATALETEGNTAEAISQHALQAVGLSYQSAKVSFVNSYTDAASLLKDGHVQVFTLGTTIPASSVMDVAAGRVAFVAIVFRPGYACLFRASMPLLFTVMGALSAVPDASTSDRRAAVAA